MDIQNRVVNYYKNNGFIQMYLRGIDTNTNEVVLNINNKEKRIGIDVLENIKTDEELNAYFNGTEATFEPKVDDLPNLDAVAINPVVKEETLDNTETKETLNDVKILIELKNKDGLDNILKKFSVNPSTGLIDINKAISTVTKNTMNETVRAIKNGYDFDTNINLYDIEGNYLGTSVPASSTEDEVIAKSFNNIKLYLDASKMYPDQVNYSDEQINVFMKTYISKVKEELHGKEVSKPVSPSIVPTPEIQKEIPTSASAGFADIFVLTVIVLVYAVIIVNLVLKLK